MDALPCFFTVMATGQIESGEVPGCSNAYCKYEMVAGEDWQLLGGMEAGLTQVARPAAGPERSMVWNFPLDFTFKATNAFGWPQLVVSVYGVDALGRDIVMGYGATHVPTHAGRHTLSVRLYAPCSASLLQRFANWVTGMRPEFCDPKFPSCGEGREVTRVVSAGHVTVQMNVVTKDMGTFGFSEACSAVGDTSW